MHLKNIIESKKKENIDWLYLDQQSIANFSFLFGLVQQIKQSMTIK